jgi:hypothetical protein
VDAILEATIQVLLTTDPQNNSKPYAGELILMACACLDACSARVSEKLSGEILEAVAS